VKDLKDVTLAWYAPTGFMGTPVFHATVVEEDDDFWTDVRSNDVSNQNQPTIDAAEDSAVASAASLAFLLATAMISLVIL